MKKKAQRLPGLVLSLAMLGSSSSLLAQSDGGGAAPAVTSGFIWNRLRCAIFNKRRLTLVRGEKRDLNMPNAIAGFSKDKSLVRASLEFGTLSVEGVALGKTQIVILGIGPEKHVIEVWVVDPKKFVPARQEVKAAEKATINPDGALKPNPEKTVAAKPAEEEHAKLAPPPNPQAGSASVPAPSFPPGATASVPEPTRTPSVSQASGSSGGELKEVRADVVPAATTPVGDSVTLTELTEVVVAADDVRAAYSLDPLIAEAQMGDDHVRIWGRMPGQAIVVLVHKDFSTTTLNVIVTKAPPILPDGVWAGLNGAGSGYYEGRVSSNPYEIGQIFDTRSGRMQLHIANAVLPAGNLPGVSTTWFPSSYFRYSADRWRVTLLDDRVNSSPISVDSVVLRGIHLDAGGLSIHAGYTSVAGFESLFLPVHKQLIAGFGYVHDLGDDSQLGVTAYYIQRDAFALDPNAATALATVFFRKRAFYGTALEAEVGFSKGFAGSLRAKRITHLDQFELTARYRPREYAMPDIDNLAGLQSQARWSHYWSKYFSSDFSGSDNHLFIRTGSETNEFANGNLRFRPARGVVVSTGLTVSHFSNQGALFPDVHQFSIPIALSYDRPRYGVGLQYQYSQTSRAFSAGESYGGSVRWSGSHFQVNANAGLNTDALGVDSVFSAYPGLNAALESLGFGTTTSVEQLAALLQQRAFLNSLGIAPGATLELIPRNWVGGLNLSWRSAHQSVEFNAQYNLNRFLLQKNTTALQTLRYRRGLSRATEVFASFSMFETASATRQTTPIWEAGVRHQFGGSVFSHFHDKAGTIAGTVRVQDISGTKLLRGAEITLDQDRKTTSDAGGHYQFSKVHAGVHSVQIAFKSARPFYYTTSSKVSTMADSVVDFGVLYPAAQMVGYALSDAGIGLPQIGILVKGPQGEMSLTTDKAGQFFVPVAQPGEYMVSVDAERVADGYALEDLIPVGVSVAEGEYKKVSFTLPAIRALTGVVEGYDPGKGQYVPIANATVELVELKRKTITDGKGWYAFRNLPSGTYTLTVNDQPHGQVAFGARPQLLRQDIRLSPEALAISQK